MTKICSRCQEAKDISNFYRQTALRVNDDGYDYYCKACRNQASYKSWKNNKLKCIEDNCHKSSYSRQMCRVHYNKFMRHKKKREKNEKAMLADLKLANVFRSQPYPPQGIDNA